MRAEHPGDELAALADLAERPSWRTQAHLRRCRGCRQELHELRALHEAAGQLRSRRHPPPAGALEDLLERLAAVPASARRARQRHLAYVSGVAATAAGAGAIALVVRGRARPAG